MSRLDGTAKAFVESAVVIRPIHFVYMDFLNDPVRANDSGMTLVVSGQPDAELNGTYDGVTGDMAELSPIRVGAGGTDTVTARLSGLKTLDAEMLDVIGDESRWKGRIASIWRIVWNQDGQPQGAYEHFYTGYMVDVFIGGHAGMGDEPGEQFIEVQLETYMAAYVQPSNKTYNQKPYDAGDRSFEATLGLVNGGGNGHIDILPGGGAGTGSIGGGMSSGLLINSA